MSGANPLADLRGPNGPSPKATGVESNSSRAKYSHYRLASQTPSSGDRVEASIFRGEVHQFATGRSELTFEQLFDRDHRFWCVID